MSNPPPLSGWGHRNKRYLMNFDGELRVRDLEEQVKTPDWMECGSGSHRQDQGRYSWVAEDEI